ncbi:MAG: AAC(3) family N-acetyltransferase, partial [Candidatus Marinimicrobia bacterium]|nr:AAC(3) family N-acetyltransferase [Candidatus Neomarinimicrobiota bacterium]
MENNVDNIKTNKETLIQDLLVLGVKEGDLLYIKASMRSLGRIEGGANAFIDAVLDVVGKEGTIVVSSFVKVKPLSYLKKHKEFVYNINSASYAGAVGNAIMKYPNVVLSSHPVQKFAAIGKLAEKLMGDHNEDSYAYDPLRVMSEIGGKGLIVGKDVIGVGTTHVAMGLLGYRQKRPRVGVRYKNDKGEVKLFKLDWQGMCSDGFHVFFPEYDKVPGTIIS